MEKQIEKFAKLCAVFNLLVYDDNPNCVKVVKGDYFMLVGKALLSNDYHLINSLKVVYSSFREFEQNNIRKLTETQ